MWSALCSCSVPWLDEGLSMLFPYLQILRYALPNGALPIVRLFTISPVLSVFFDVFRRGPNGVL